MSSDIEIHIEGVEWVVMVVVSHWVGGEFSYLNKCRHSLPPRCDHLFYVNKLEAENHKNNQSQNKGCLSMENEWVVVTFSTFNLIVYDNLAVT